VNRHGTRGKALREQADEVKGRLDDASKSAGKMTEAANEFDSWLSHVNDLIADTEKQVGMQKKTVKANRVVRMKAEQAVHSQQSSGDAEGSEQNGAGLHNELQQIEATLQQLQGSDQELQQQQQELEQKICGRSEQLSQLHSAKAAAVTGKQFKQATQLSQQIRQISEAEQTDGDALAQLMEQLDSVRAQLTDAERRAEQKQMEIMSLEQANAVDESAMDEPPGCDALRQAVSGSAEAGCQEMSRFLELELATLLACAQAAQGYPLEEWSYRFAAGGAVAPAPAAPVAPVAAPTPEMSLLDFEPSALAAAPEAPIDLMQPAAVEEPAGANDSSSSSDSDSSSDDDSDADK